MLYTFLTLISIALFLLCLTASQKKHSFFRNCPLLNQILAFHSVFGILFLLFSLAHGLLSSQSEAMISGKLAWMVLLFLILFTLARRKFSAQRFRKIHIFFSLLLCFLVGIHIVHALLIS